MQSTVMQSAVLYKPSL